MKRFQVFLGVALLCLADFAFAQAATVFELKGSAQAIPAAGAPRNLHAGDSLMQGDTVTTAAGSSAVLQFADGQVIAVTPASRVTITSYVYNRNDPAKGKVVISLAEGGMRAVTGAIGKANPGAVSYQAGGSTISVLGTDINIGTVGGNLSISVTQGQISFVFQGKTTTVNAGEGVDARTDGTVRKAALAEFVAGLSPEMKAVFSDADRITLDRLIRQAGQQDLRDNPASPIGTQSTRTGSSGSGGGAASGGGSTR